MPDSLHQRREVRELPMQVRREPVGSVNVKARTVEVTWTTGAGVIRTDWWTGERYTEQLDLSPKAVRMARMQAGAPVLASHNQSDLAAVVGVVERAWLDGGQGVALLRFADDEESDKVFRKVEQKILRFVSVGYIVHRYQKTEGAAGELPVWRAIDWEPAEISIVAVPADPGAQVRSAIPGEDLSKIRTFTCTFIPEEKRTMTQANADVQSAVLAERQRASDIQSRVRHFGLPQEFGDTLVARGLSFEESCAVLVDEVARRKAHPPINPVHGSHIEVVSDHGTVRAAMVDALVHRMGGIKSLPEASWRFRNMTLVDLGAQHLENSGVSTRHLSANEIAVRALSTSDFPALLADSLAKHMGIQYQAAPSYMKPLGRKMLARDFRTMSIVQVGEAPALLEVKEGGEYKAGKIVDAKETFAVKTHGRIFAITRQAIVNDDLSGLEGASQKFAAQATALETSQLTSLFTTNAATDDTGLLFNATAVTTAGGHANYATGTGSALSATSLAAGFKAMRLQKGVDGLSPVNIVPKYLLVPAALEYAALQLVADISPTTASDVNVFGKRLEVIVNPALDANSTTAWYLAAEPSRADTIAFAYLQDEEGLRVETRAGWEIDGIEFKARLDWGCGVIGWRGLYKSAGA